MSRFAALSLSSLVLIVPLAAQDRLFRPADFEARSTVAKELRELLRVEREFLPLIGLAAVVGARLPSDSHAAFELRSTLRTANAAIATDRAAASRLRSELGDLVRVLEFEPTIEAAQPEGFPQVGAVDEIELRSYPRYRMARTTMRGGQMGAFWPLFQHIKSNDIAMTTPVQMDWQAGDDRQPAQMAFLYGDKSTAPRSTAANVEIVDIEPMTVLTLGAIGYEGRERVAAMRARLLAWLATPTCPVAASGDFRTMGYNSPSVPRDERYFEIQIPVCRRSF
ncbi:MAG: heme-binding protein [bacterium]|nr:heme-binding protein [bacterium]